MIVNIFTLFINFAINLSYPIASNVYKAFPAHFVIFLTIYYYYSRSVILFYFRSEKIIFMIDFRIFRTYFKIYEIPVWFLSSFSSRRFEKWGRIVALLIGKS